MRWKVEVASIQTLQSVLNKLTDEGYSIVGVTFGPLPNADPIVIIATLTSQSVNP